MPATDLERRPTEPGTGKPHLVHLICCRPPRTRSFCGISVECHGAIWTDGQVPPEDRCIVCDQMARERPLACPEGGPCQEVGHARN